MVTAISKGRLGNFSFVNMAAYAYSLKHGLDFHIQDRTLAPQWPLYFQELKNTNWDNSLERVYVNDGKHSYTELPFKEEWRNKNIIIGSYEDINTGYFQSYKYMKGYEDEIRVKFSLPTTYVPNTIGVHIRRGDFLSLEDKHPVITSEYLCVALSCLSRFVNKDTSIIFYSDDIEWSKNWAKTNFDYYDRLLFSENHTPEHDFMGLMLHEHLVVSNSTFSVLAAILNPNPNKIIICPEKFFGAGNAHLDESTIYPHGWIKLKY